MPTKQIAGVIVDTDDEGYLVNPNQWNREIAAEIARELGIDLSDAHWKVIEFIRQDAKETGSTPNIRRISKVAMVSIKDLYELFPNGPAKNAAKIAGVKKPTGCV